MRKTQIAIILGLLMLLTPIGTALTSSPTTLEIVNLSGTSHVFSSSQLLEMPKTVVYAELYCDGALTTYGNWSGVPLSHLLTEALATPEVGSLQFAASDGYRVNIPIDLAMQPTVIIAYEKDGQPLVEGLRLIIPGANGAAWIALITSITMNTAGADYPASVSVSVPKADNRPTQSISPSTQTPNPQPPTQTPSTVPNIAQGNVTLPNQPTITPQTTNQSIDLQTTTAYLAGLAFAATLASTTYMVLRHKRKQPL